MPVTCFSDIPRSSRAKFSAVTLPGLVRYPRVQRDASTLPSMITRTAPPSPSQRSRLPLPFLARGRSPSSFPGGEGLTAFGAARGTLKVAEQSWQRTVWPARSSARLKTCLHPGHAQEIGIGGLLRSTGSGPAPGLLPLVEVLEDRSPLPEFLGPARLFPGLLDLLDGGPEGGADVGVCVAQPRFQRRQGS